jgi:nucleoside-diphosphate-sugar epimerase
MPASRIILPGGAGLVGQNLVTRLESAGYRDLVVLDKHEANLRTLSRLHPGVEAEAVDLAEPGEWQGRFAGAAAIVMLQAQIGALTAEPFLRNNIRSTEHVLAAAKEHRVPYIVHVSSSVVESVANDHYTSSKRRQEELVLESGISAIVLRPTLMFGWFDRKHLGWLSRFMARVPVFPIPGHGRYMRQPLYTGDFCNIIIRCLETRLAGRVMDISGRERIDYIDIIRAIRQATRARTLIVPIPYRLFHALLALWALFDNDPPFTTRQLEALVAGDSFEVIDWEAIFAVNATPFADAIRETFQDPRYSKIALEF